MPDPKRSRPAGGEAAADPTQGLVLDRISAADEIARHVDGAFVLVVERTGGKYHRRCYLSCRAAERAVERAVARGEGARLYLAELRPVWRVTGGE